MTEETRREADGEDRTDEGIAKEFLSFLLHHKKWWLIPLLAILVLLVVMMVVFENSPLVPFIYNINQS